MPITRDWVLAMASEYSTSEDSEVLDVIHPRVQARGFYDRADFETVGRWKSPRAIRCLERNSDSTIEYVTRTAFSAPDDLRHRVLTLLDGVQQPMASALLMVWDPTEHTVYDVRAMRALRKHGYVSGPSVDYTVYREICLRLADEVSVDLRTLDRALYVDGRS